MATNKIAGQQRQGKEAHPRAKLSDAEIGWVRDTYEGLQAAGYSSGAASRKMAGLIERGQMDSDVVPDVIVGALRGDGWTDGEIWHCLT